MPKHKKKGPLSLQGAPAAAQQPKRDSRHSIISLRVLQRDSATAGRGASALLHPADLQQLLQHDSTAGEAVDSSVFLQLAAGSDVVLHARSTGAAQQGTLLADEVQCHNLRLCPGEAYKFSLFFVPGSSSSTDGGEASGSSEADDEEEAGGSDTAMPHAAEADSSSDADAADAQLPFELVDVDLEVRLVPTAAAAAGGGGCVQVDARALAAAFSKQCCWRVLAVGQLAVVDLPGLPPLLLRVAAANNLTAEEQQERVAYHCYRGMLTPETRLYFTAASTAAASPPGQQQQQQHQAGAAIAAAAADSLAHLSLSEQQQQQQQQQQQPPQHHHANGSAQPAGQQQPQPGMPSHLPGAVQLLHAVARPPAAANVHVVHVTTSDGEYFPVAKRLLRPCIALTRVVRDSGATAPSVTVNIDCATFDRVLIFLERRATRRKPPRFAVHLLLDLLDAAKELGLRPLQEFVSDLLGSKAAALSVFSFADVQRANAAGSVWLILDGMVLDVGRWLPEHPGGATIIPQQSLDCDCARFFEMYHASRESFIYLQEFYIGELSPCDREAVPMGGRHPPSEDFLAQLRQYTQPYRTEMLARAAEQAAAGGGFKSF